MEQTTTNSEVFEKTSQNDGPAQQQQQQQQQQQPNLLLSYIYFLDKKQTIKIQIGFNIENFAATIIFQRQNKVISEMNYSEWYAFYHELKNNQAKLNSKGFLLAFNHADRTKKLTLQQDQYTQFCHMVDFIQAVMSYNYGAELNVREYVTKYFERCIEKNKLRLEQEDFYIPMNLHIAQCNYSRLFYEIPIFLSEKIYWSTINKTNIF